MSCEGNQPTLIYSHMSYCQIVITKPGLSTHISTSHNPLPSTQQVPVDCDCMSSRVMECDVPEGDLLQIASKTDSIQIDQIDPVTSDQPKSSRHLEQGAGVEPRDALGDSKCYDRNHAIPGYIQSLTVKNGATLEHASIINGEQCNTNTGFKQDGSIFVRETSTEPEHCEAVSTQTHCGKVSVTTSTVDWLPECNDPATTSTSTDLQKKENTRSGPHDFSKSSYLVSSDLNAANMSIDGQNKTADISITQEVEGNERRPQTSPRDLHTKSNCTAKSLQVRAPASTVSSDGDETEEIRANSIHPHQSYLDAATKAEAIVRQCYQRDSLESWLGHLPTSVCSTSVGSKTSFTENSSLVVIQSLPSDPPTRERVLKGVVSLTDDTGSSLNEVLVRKEVANEDEITEPPFNWDDYQASLYSSSCDTDGVMEPANQYVEEFAWDEDDIHVVSLEVARPDEGDLDSLGDEGEDETKQRAQWIEERDGQPDQINTAANLTHSPYRPFSSSQSSDHPVVPDKAGTVDSLGRQDTLELLSTSTSVIFSQPAGLSPCFSACASVKVDELSTPREVPDFSPRIDRRGTMRTHPDGGSQNHLAVSPEGCDEVFTHSGLPTDPIYETFWKKVKHLTEEVRRCQTLPFSSRRKRALLRYNQSAVYSSADAPIWNSPLSTSLLHRPHRRFGSRSLIHQYSEKQFNVISRELSQLVTSPALLDNERQWSRKEDQPANSRCLSLGEWQKSLSDIIWRAEGNVALLESTFTDSSSHSMESLNSSGDGRCATGIHSWTGSHNPTFYHRRKAPLGSNNQDLLSRWTKLVEGARNHLLTSCSKDALRSRLSPLRDRLKDLNESVRCVLQDMDYLGQLEQTKKKEGGCADVYQLRSNLNTQLKQCLSELESICDCVEKLRNLVNRRTMEVTSLPSRNLQSAISSKTAPALLIPEVDLAETVKELTSQLEANRIMLLIAQLVSPTSPILGVEHTPTAVCLRSPPRCYSNRSNRLSQVATIGLDLPSVKVPGGSVPGSKANSLTLVTSWSSEHPTLQSPECRNSPTNEQGESSRSWLRNWTVLLIGGLLALAYVVCYYLVALTPRLTLPENLWDHEEQATRSVWTQMVEYFFVWRRNASHGTGPTNPCRAWRDRIPPVIEIIQSPRPF